MSHSSARTSLRWYGFISRERIPLAGRCRRLAENFVPHSWSGEAREFVERESCGPPDSARGPRALPGVPGGTLNTYPLRGEGRGCLRAGAMRTLVGQAARS
jgi:hypothetical protein